MLILKHLVLFSMETLYTRETFERKKSKRKRKRKKGREILLYFFYLLDFKTHISSFSKTYFTISKDIYFYQKFYRFLSVIDQFMVFQLGFFSNSVYF